MFDLIRQAYECFSRRVASKNIRAQSRDLEQPIVNTKEEDDRLRPKINTGYGSDVHTILAASEEAFNEATIPRSEMNVFQRQLRFMRPESYLYRIDAVDSPKIGRTGLSDLPSQGHRYVNSFDNLPRAERHFETLGRDLRLLSRVKNKVVSYLQNGPGGGLYCYLSLRDAVAEQHVQPSRAEMVSSLSKYREQISVLTRYRKRSSLGKILPDPLPMGRASAALQVARYSGNTIASVSPDQIEIWYDGAWHCLKTFDLGNLLRDVNNGQLQRLLFPPGEIPAD